MESTDTVIIKLVVDRPKDKSERQRIAGQSQEVWQENYGIKRTGSTSKWQGGSASSRDADNLTHAAWLKKHKAETERVVVDALEKRSIETISVLASAPDDPTWTEAHNQ